MKQVRCTQCGSPAVIADTDSSFLKCSSCGSMFSVRKAQEFEKVEIDRTADLKSWREYMYKQLAVQENSTRKRDYESVKVFAAKILSVLPDDFCATYYSALSEYMNDNEHPYLHFLHNSSFLDVTDTELNEVTDKIIFYAEPRLKDSIIDFVKRAYPLHYEAKLAALDAALEHYVARRREVAVTERDVFICHRTAAVDQDVADAICTRLEKSGLRCWIAPRNIFAGSQNYDRDIAKGVESCRVFLFVSSLKSMYSEDCETELKLAVMADKVLYSYRIDSTPYDGTFKKFMSNVQWLDAEDDPFAHLEQLTVDIKSILAADDEERRELDRKREKLREAERIEAERKRRNEEERLSRIESLMGLSTVDYSAPREIKKIDRLAKRIKIELSDGHFEKATELIDALLNEYPESSEAWWLYMLADLNVADDEKLISLGIDYSSNRGYKNARRFADEEFDRYIDIIDERFVNTVIRAAMIKLDVAEQCYRREDYVSMEKALNACSTAFKSADSPLLSRFSDYVSRYYWLRLWLKYREQVEECEQNIKRETEYINAYKYGTAVQRAHYDDVCAKIARNTEVYLRRCTPDRRNDQMVINYLSDNKGIIPEDVYKRFSSLMYFRQMLANANIDEDTLRKSTKDISTDQYFMLAYETGLPDQREYYDSIVDQIQKNGLKKAAVQTRVKSDAEKQVVTESSKTSRTVFLVCSILLTFTLVMLLQAFRINRVPDTLVFAAMIISAASIVGLCLIGKIKHCKKSAFFVYVLPVFAVLTLVLGIISLSVNQNPVYDYHDQALAQMYVSIRATAMMVIIFSFIATVLSFILLGTVVSKKDATKKANIHSKERK